MALSQLLADRCEPAGVQSIDPADGQLAFARACSASRVAQFHKGDAMALSFPDERFNVAVMALVILYVSDPARAISEVVRVTKPHNTRFMASR
jgi:ubiquinone/menaquinone biosynthesis C-methylase UbiE